MRLRLLAPLLAVLACAGLAAPARAQNVRIGFIDSQRIFNEYKSAQEAQDRFAREIQSWRTEADDRRKQVDDLRNQLKDQDPMLSESKRLEMESTLQKAVSDYDRFVQDFWGPNGKVQRLNDEITARIGRSP
jgi:outer membrane protein